MAAWRETLLFTGAERAALALTESATRISDRSDAVPDAVREEAARYYDEAALASLAMNIAHQLVESVERDHSTARGLGPSLRRSDANQPGWAEACATVGGELAFAHLFFKKTDPVLEVAS